MAYLPVTDVIAYVLGEMKKNVKSGAAVAIRDWLDGPCRENRVPIKLGADRARANKKWYEMVKIGGPWDHKKVIKKNYGEWTVDALSKTLYAFDIWSNLHYGYVGASCGFGEDWLLAGQGQADTIPAGTAGRVDDPTAPLSWVRVLDDSTDQWAISLGYGLWENYQDALTAEQLLNTLRGFAMYLSTKAA